MCRRFPDLFLLTAGKPNGGLILLYLKVRDPILAHLGFMMEKKVNGWNGMVTPRPDKPDKILPDRARPINGWFYLASCTRCLQETSRKLSRWCQTAPEFPFVYKKRQNLVLSGTIWPTSLQTSGAGSQIEPAIFLSGSVWLRLAWFCLVRLVLV